METERNPANPNPATPQSYLNAPRLKRVSVYARNQIKYSEVLRNMRILGPYAEMRITKSRICITVELSDLLNVMEFEDKVQCE